MLPPFMTSSPVPHEDSTRNKIQDDASWSEQFRENSIEPEDLHKPSIHYFKLPSVSSNIILSNLCSVLLELINELSSKA
uniref:Uncharacterized protein n=1 Tax=Oryza barthii TaxID=65489 RepID=A0A0D3EZ03_9ORYZ